MPLGETNTTPLAVPKVAVSVSFFDTTNWHGLETPVQLGVVPDQPVSAYGGVGVAVICMLSPGRGLQRFATHAAGVVRSAAVTVPLALAVALTLNVNVAVTIWLVAPAVSAHGVVVPVQVPVPPDQPTKLSPAVGTAASVTVSPGTGAQLGFAVQATAASVTVAVPSPMTAAVTVGFAANEAASASDAVAVNVQVAPCGAHEVPVQITKWKPAFGVAVMRIWSPESAVQVFEAQFAGVVRSAAVTVPPAVPADAVIVNVATKVAASFSFVLALNRHVAVCPAHEDPAFQLAKRKPVAAVAVTCMWSPTSAVQLLDAQFAGVVRSAAAAPPPVPEDAVIVTVATNDAMSFSAPVALYVQVAPWPVHEVPAFHPENRKPLLGVATICIESDAPALQTLTTAQSPGVVRSDASTVPPVPADAVIRGSPAAALWALALYRWCE